MKLKCELVLGDPNNNFLQTSIRDDNKEKSIETRLHEVDPLRNANGNNEVITIAEKRHIQRQVEHKVDPMLCRGDLDFFCNRPATPKYQRPRTHERTLDIPQNLDDLEVNEFADVVRTIAEDLHLTQCAQVCFTGTEDDQAEQHDHGTNDKVRGDPDMEQGGDAPEEADREVDLPERVPLPDHPESRPYTLNHEVGIDVFEIIDSVDKRSSTLDSICKGVVYVQAYGLREKSECSSSPFHTRLQASVCDWSCRAGWPKLVRNDQGTHDRDVLCSIHIENRVMIRLAGLGIPEQINRAGRRGDMSKKMMTKTIKDKLTFQVEN